MKSMKLIPRITPSSLTVKKGKEVFNFFLRFVTEMEQLVRIRSNSFPESRICIEQFIEQYTVGARKRDT